MGESPTPESGRSPLDTLAHPRRRQILRLVWDEERAAGEIAARFEVTFGAVSQHLKVLRDAGIVKVRQEGRKRYYSARKKELGPLAAYLEQTWRMHLETLKAVAEAHSRKQEGPAGKINENGGNDG